MEQFISYFYYLVYDPVNCNWYWPETSNEYCLWYGFWTLVVSAFAVVAFFYYFWSNNNVSVHATTGSWLKVGLVGMLITWIASELIVGYASQLEGMNAYIGDSGADILIFCLYNGIVGFAIFYLLFSTALQITSQNAKNIPWHFYNK